MKDSAWIQKNTGSLSGKTVAVSGSTGGLGRPLCFCLAGLGASLLLLDRNQKKVETLSSELLREYPSLSLTHIPVDLSDFSSVRAAKDRLISLSPDCLILNAGAYSIPRERCDTGFDNVFQINFLAPYYLARHLYPSISARGGRIVAVGSIAHRYSATDPSDVDFSNRKKASLVYGNAKRTLMATLPALSEKEGEIVLAHPGITFTNITAHYPPLIFALIKHPMKIIFPPPAKAVRSILWGLFAPVGRDVWIGPRLFDIWGDPKIKPLRSIPKEERRRLISLADEIFRTLD